MRLLVSVSVALAAGWASSAGAQTAAQGMPAPAAAAPPPAGMAPAAGPPPAAGQGADPFATPPSLDGTAAAAPAAAAPAAAAPAADVALDRDPYEKFNRAMWGFDETLDRVALKPVAKAYRFVTPRPARRGISHVFANLSEPWSFINNLLQGKVGRAMNNLGRFVVNTTIGVGGLADNASKLGIRPADEDFGQTLAVWGARHSPYLVLPVFGPSTIRDGIGTGVAFFADPVPICLKDCTNLSWTERFGIQALHVVNTRSELIDSGADAFLESSLDPYASARSAYLQSRAAQIDDTDDGGATMARPADVNPTTTTPAPAPGATTPPATPPAADPFATPPPLSGQPSASAAGPGLPLTPTGYDG